MLEVTYRVVKQGVVQSQRQATLLSAALSRAPVLSIVWASRSTFRTYIWEAFVSFIRSPLLPAVSKLKKKVRLRFL